LGSGNVRCALSMAAPSRQASDVSMGAVSDGGLDRAAHACVAAVAHLNERLEDGLATTAVRLATQQTTQTCCPAHCHANIATHCHSQVNDSTGVGGEEEVVEEEEGEGEYEDWTELTGVMERGAAMLTRFDSCSQQGTQESEFDDPEYEKTECRKTHFKNINGATWAQKKVDTKKGEMSKLVKQHQKSMRELSQPMRNLISEMPAKKDSLSVMSGIFQEAVYNAEVRQAIFDASDVLKQQVSPAWQGSMLSLA